MSALAALRYLAEGLVAGLAFGVGFGVCWIWVVHKMRYRNPQLHDGVWHQPYHPKGETRWHNAIGPSPDVLAHALREGTHRHGVAVCCITDHLAHEDRCWCGAVRYGIFGSWQEPADASH